jgi:hypothetical protein
MESMMKLTQELGELNGEVKQRLHELSKRIERLEGK